MPGLLAQSNSIRDSPRGSWTAVDVSMQKRSSARDARRRRRGGGQKCGSPGVYWGMDVDVLSDRECWQRRRMQMGGSDGEREG